MTRQLLVLQRNNESFFTCVSTPPINKAKMKKFESLDSASV